MHVFSYFFGIFQWVTVVVVLVIFLLPHLLRNGGRHTWWGLSKEEIVSQLFILLSLFFLGLALLAFNDSFGGPLSKLAVLFAVSAVGIIVAYRLRVVCALAFGLVGLAVWWGAQSFQWLQVIEGVRVNFSVLIVGWAFLGLVFYVFGRLHQAQMRFKRFAVAYMLVGMAMVTGLLFLFSTEFGVGVIGEMTKGWPFSRSWQLVLTMLAFFALAMGTTLYGAVRKLLSWPEALGVLVLVFLFGVMALLPEQAVFAQRRWLFSGQLSGTGYFWALVYNMAVFFELLGLILIGYARREAWLVNLGSLFLFLLILVKYFDWFFTFLDKSVFFIGAGILLFAVGWLMERGRRYMISSIKGRVGESGG